MTCHGLSLYLEPPFFAQVLVIMHELSDREQYDDYLARVLAPAKPMIVLGRSARAHPPRKVEECLWHTWKDRNRVHQWT